MGIEILGIILAALLSQNYILVKCRGVKPDWSGFRREGGETGADDQLKELSSQVEQRNGSRLEGVERVVWR